MMMQLGEVLLVDDDPDLLKLISLRLSSAGYTVRTANSGEAALAAMSVGRPAAVITDLPPMVKWTAAVIAGGGVAGITQGVTAMLRAKSTIFTGGLGNPVIATAELAGALLISLLTLAAPLAALALVILFLWLAIRLLLRMLRGAQPSNAGK